MARTTLAYTEKHGNWVLENANKYDSYEKLTKEFNNYFKETRKVCGFQQFVTKKLGIYLVTKRKTTHYTEEEEKWLIDNYDKHDNYKELTNCFNTCFGRDKKITAIREKCTKKLGIKGMKNPTTYQHGNKKEQHPIGTIVKTSDGYAYMKMVDSAGSYQSGYRKPYWLPLQEKVWIDHYGEVSEGKMVIFLDGNKENTDINNLYCIDRKISAVMASNSWYSENSALTLTAIKWCELYYSLNKKEEIIMRELQFEEEVRKIILAYKDGSPEPLDGDEVDRLSSIIKAEINLIEGNMNEQEYNDALDADYSENHGTYIPNMLDSER